VAEAQALHRLKYGWQVVGHNQDGIGIHGGRDAVGEGPCFDQPDKVLVTRSVPSKSDSTACENPKMSQYATNLCSTRERVSVICHVLGFER